MALKFQPKTRNVVMCNFSGFVEPEMIKVRPVVIIARNRYNNKLVTVVPLSTTKPVPARDCHHQLSVNPLPDKANILCWAKCDMVSSVSIDRLDRYKVRTALGREYMMPIISDEDFEFIRKCVLCGIGMKHMIL
ncbi:type II toxin-antitoxin system PemK/MazF family toxin [Yersinia ruckeri]|uniref:type II toxin-antitoxin system PemK/MazF family toxin n=1 Tax=Yersinia ruckeri TaxID=29486 RepID=UPI0020BE8B33|nr:type II toxin-antitoxin system PemK/MazF family toxin [Yersinia ruckeri]MCK8543809.1 type II toxin-antitoxin system PemK/MazF family toxin [Yersinia ruckeri]MCK8553388.1 type II toxin-antitoxin system PemK/MazF family toxin [Yersinia ruckeri]MCW6518901.1 type II toxin-antitoxin system PemK/MazF family toxin [Yersinia ruckeri]MCW6576986.1 type II toxin-antitoxin system PemK/MazF family toxin [Yersinia ruckeri]MCW6586374.1 type II toxin-antitoxin system PemK/MazF family toxin [Yersinia rucker